MAYIEQLAQQGGSQALSGIMGLVLGGINDRRQLRQQEKLQNLQIAGQKQLVDYNMMKQLQMWQDTSYQAQVQQMVKAGINPALLYGMSGGGGQSIGNTSASVQGGSAQQNPGEIQTLMGMGLQNGLLAEQRKLIEAQTRNVEADTAIKQQGPANVQADTAMKIANTGNIQADTELKKVSLELQNISKQIQTATIEDQIRIISQNAAKLDEEVQQLGIKTGIDRATQETVIKQIKTNLVKTVLENALTKSQTGKTDQEIMLLSQENKAFLDKLSNELTYKNRLGLSAMTSAGASEHNADMKAFETTWQQAMNDVPESQRAVIETVKNVIQAIFLGKLLRGQNPTEVRGFHNR